MKPHIDILVNFQNEPNFWFVTALAQHDLNSFDSPEPFGDSEDFQKEESAVHHAEGWAELLIHQGYPGVTILVNGTERKTYRPDTALSK